MLTNGDKVVGLDRLFHFLYTRVYVYSPCSVYMDREIVEATLEKIQRILDEPVSSSGRLDRLLVAAAELLVIEEEMMS